MSSSSMTPFLVFLLFVIFLHHNNHKPPIDPTEQEALYNIFNSVNPTIPWRTLFPGDLCHSPPPGVVCRHNFSSSGDNKPKSHVVELNFGYVSNETQTLPCSSNATLDPILFTTFTHLQKLSFHNCFNNTQNILHLPSQSLPPSLEELVFIDNPSVVSPLQPFLCDLTSLKKLVLIGNGFNGELPPQICDFHNLEELILSRNNLSGEIPVSLEMLKKLKVLDLSHNDFKGCVWERMIESWAKTEKGSLTS